MGDGEESTPPKSSKPPASTQEIPSTPSYPDWSTSMQAYYGAGATPPPFFPSPVAPPSPHPYIWGGQHPMMPPYGTPLPYPALYPHGALYAHPSMATAQGVALTNTDMEVKTPDGKDPASIKKSKAASGNMGLISGKSGESGKAGSVSGNDGASQSGESGSEASSDATDENANQASSAVKKRSFNLADGSNAKSNSASQYTGVNHSASVPGKPVVPMPTTNLNIGMDLWNASPAGGTAMKTRPQSSGASPQVASATIVGREGMLQDHQWIQDERELKRQRRKQSNRESARRSRLRKQAECEELQSKVENLSNENHVLREELHRLAEQCEKLTSENNSIMEELTRLYGPEATSSLQDNNHNLVLHPINGEDNGHVQDASPLNNSSSTSDQNGKFSSNGKI